MAATAMVSGDDATAMMSDGDAPSTKNFSRFLIFYSICFMGMSIIYAISVLRKNMSFSKCFPIVTCNLAAF